MDAELMLFHEGLPLTGWRMEVETPEALLDDDCTELPGDDSSKLYQPVFGLRSCSGQPQLLLRVVQLLKAPDAFQSWDLR